MQGQRTVGIAETAHLVPLDTIDDLFDITSPRHDGMNIVEAVEGLIEARGEAGRWLRGEQEMRETYAAVAGFLYRTRALRYFAGFLGLARLQPLVPVEGEQTIGRLFSLEATPLLREAVRFRV